MGPHREAKELIEIIVSPAVSKKGCLYQGKLFKKIIWKIKFYISEVCLHVMNIPKYQKVLLNQLKDIICIEM